MKVGKVSGKGWSDEEARASCLGEAAERCSAMFRGDEQTITSSFAELNQSAVNPSSLLQFSVRQYAMRNDWNAIFGDTQYIPEPWEENCSLEWAPCRSLSENGHKLVPAGACFLRYAPPEPRIIFPNLTTGYAAAPTADEATLRGFLELVEHDAIALWWFNRCRRPAIDIDNINDDDLNRARAYLNGRGRSFHVLDITTDFGIPVVVAVSATVEGEAILFGMAADFDLLHAVKRAVAELFQLLGPGHYWSRSSMLEHYQLPTDRQAWVFGANLENQQYVLPEGVSSCVPAPPLAHSVSDRLEQCIRAAARVGTEILVCDVTRPDVGTPVVKVIAPGLRTSWAQLGPGRLYKAPVALGWQARVLAEEELNPFPFSH
jgi:ribosomal protein S12 methylthiotransferase accessory factor